MISLLATSRFLLYRTLSIVDSHCINLVFVSANSSLRPPYLFFVSWYFGGSSINNKTLLMFLSLSIIIVLKLIVLILTARCSETATLNVKSIHLLNCVSSEYTTICRKHLSQTAESIVLLFVYRRYSLVSKENSFN